MRAGRVLVAVGVLAGMLAVPLAGSENAVAVSGVGEGVLAPAMGPDFRISGDAASKTWFPAVATNETDGEVLVVWADARGGWNIYGRRVGADGTAIGPDVQICGDTQLSARWAPTVAWNRTSNEYLVVWQDTRNSPADGGDWDIYGRRLEADGTPVGPEFRVSAAPDGSDQSSPQVVWNETENQFLVVWEDWRDASTRMADIYGRRVGADGSLVGGDFRVSGGSATGNELAASLAWNGLANEYLVVWEDGRDKATRGTDVWGRCLGADGTPAGTDFQISAGPAPADVFFPKVVWNTTSNEYMVVWEDWRNAATWGGDVFGHRLGADGTSLGGDFRISNGPGTSEEMRPALSWDRTADEYLVVWEENRADSDWPLHYRDIYGRRLGAAGVAVEDEFRISGDGGVLWEQLPALAQTGQRGHLVIWADGRSGDDWEIYGRRVPSGTASAEASLLVGAGEGQQSQEVDAADPTVLTAPPDAGNDVAVPPLPEGAASPVGRTPGPLITVDVGFVYTRATRVQAGGLAALEAWVANGVMYTNEALERSEVDVRLRVVFVEEVDYHAYSACVGNMAPLYYSSVLAPARALRDSLGADLLTLISEDGNAGIANLNGPYSQIHLARVFPGELKTTYWARTFAHEWGHNFGAHHEQATGCTPPACGYDAPDSAFSDIMSYGTGCHQDNPAWYCPYIPNYSNPRVAFSWLDPPVLWGDGNAYDTNALANFNTAMRKGPAAQPTGAEGVADNAAVMNQNAPAVASWRPTVIPEGHLCSGIPATWVGTDGADVFEGTSLRDVIVAGDGDDVIHGLGGSDVICAGPGNDQVYGGADSDFVFGGPGNDTLYGEAGDDFLDGESGNDSLYGGTRHDVLSGGEGDDSLDGGDGNDYLHAGPGNDVLFGGGGVDRLLGREGNDRLEGGDDDDWVQPGPGTDTIVGPPSGSNYERGISFEDTDGPVELDLSPFTPFSPATTTAVNGTGIVYLENVKTSFWIGSRFDDRLLMGDWRPAWGLFGNDYLVGGTWSRLYGDDGDDRLNGGPQTPVDGGAGADACRGSTATNCEINLTDTTAPVVTVPADMTVEATSAAGRVVSFTASADDFPDPDPAVICAPPSGSTFPLGATTVACSATDAAGNTGRASFAFTVGDSTAPTLALPLNMTVEATGPAGRVVSFTATAADLVAPLSPSVTCVPASGSTFPLGTTTVNCSASDTAGNPAAGSFTITVRDTTGPTVGVHAPVTVEATGPSGATVTFTNPTASDLVAPLAPTVSCVPASGQVFALGASTVTCSATDTAGNTGTSSFTVTVRDTTDPEVTAPADMTVQATSASGASVSYPAATATDAVGVTSGPTCLPASGSLFAVGATTVICTASDAAGNVGSASFTVTVSPFLLEAVFRSLGGYDGWVLEEYETSGKGGTFDFTATTARVGDDASDRQWRSILHFDTSGLPDDAVITGVTLRIKKQSITGTNPFTSHGFLTVDMRTGAFHDSSLLEKYDFQAAGNRGNVGRFVRTPVDRWHRAPLRAVSYPLINLTGTTQFRLRFATDDNDDMGADYLSFYTGDAAEADRPQLIVTYYLP